MCHSLSRVIDDHWRALPQLSTSPPILQADTSDNDLPEDQLADLLASFNAILECKCTSLYGASVAARARLEQLESAADRPQDFEAALLDKLLRAYESQGATHAWLN